MYLWVNILDLDQVGTVGPFGSPLNLMMRPALGDKLLGDGVYHSGKLDDMFVLVQCAPERAEAIKDALELIGKKKMRRKVRTRITQNLPQGKHWRTVGQ